MNVKDLEFRSLSTAGRKLLLTALNISLKNMKCKYCGEKVDYDNCCILPALKKKPLATITCDSPLCLSEYLEDYEKLKS